MTIPQQLVQAFESWDTRNRQPQGGFLWNPDSWHRRLDKLAPGSSVNFEDALGAIRDATSETPDSKLPAIDRDAVIRLSTPKALNSGGDAGRPQRVVTAFIASMIWGYGQVGYGPYRTERVLTTSKDAIKSLVDIANTAQDPEYGGLHAFKSIAGNRKSAGDYLKYLGPAFGTKFLYFLTKGANGVETTPVMDALVAKWFRQHAPEVEKFKLSWWDPTSYEQYLGSLRAWARALSELRPGGDPLDLDDVELLLFSTIRDGSGEAWAAPIEADAVGIESMLDHLASEASERRGPDHNEGTELIEQLREWFSHSSD